MCVCETIMIQKDFYIIQDVSHGLL